MQLNPKKKMLVSKRLFTFLIILITLVIYFSSCSNGKIVYSNRTPNCLEIRFPEFDDTLGISSEASLSEYRNRNRGIFENIKTVILSNTSRSKIISFTVKIDASKDLPNSTSQTEIIKLNPGEQHELGCTKTISYVIDKKRKTIRLDTLDVIAYNYSVVGEVILKR